MFATKVSTVKVADATFNLSTVTELFAICVVPIALFANIVEVTVPVSAVVINEPVISGIVITLSAVGLETCNLVSKLFAVEPSNCIEAPLIVKPAPTSVPPEVIPPVVLNASLPKSIDPPAEVIELFEIVMFAISADWVTSKVCKPVKF